MKTLKITLMAAVMACTMTSLAFADGIQEKPGSRPMMQAALNIDFQRALANAPLVAAMYRQVTLEDLKHSPGHILVVTVVLRGKIYRISGTLDQWYKFLMRGGTGQVNRYGSPAIE
jgi:hypothetical protein